MNRHAALLAAGAALAAGLGVWFFARRPGAATTLLVPAAVSDTTAQDLAYQLEPQVTAIANGINQLEQARMPGTTAHVPGASS